MLHWNPALRSILPGKLSQVLSLIWTPEDA